MSQENNVFKNQARRLQKHLAATFPGFTYSQSLEATAALHGAANWRTLIGQEQVGSPTAAPAAVASDARYIVIEGMFLETDGRRLPSRYVFDKADERVVLMQIQTANGNWDKADRSQVERVDVCLFPDFEFDSRTEVNALPAWASQVDKNASFTQSHGDMPFEAGPPEGVFGFGPPMSKVEKFLAAEREYQYRVVHYFEHPDSGFSSAIRFVVDMCAYKVVAVQVETAPKKWVDADAAQIAKFDATLKAAYTAVLKDGEEAFSPPEWATLVDGESESQNDPRYLISEGWGHIFGAGMPDSTVRFVFDMVENKIIFMDIMSWKGWVACGPDQMADVEDSLKNANEEVFTDPDEFNCTLEDTLPEWAQPEPVPTSPATEPKPSSDGARYVFGEWDHDYNGMGRPSRIRFVFDTEKNRLTRCQDKVEGVWEESPANLFISVHNSFCGAEDHVIADPKGNDLVESDELPPWAR